MDDFIAEIKEMDTASLRLILADQQDLYSEEELTLIREELNNRGDTDNLSSLAAEELVGVVLNAEIKEQEHQLQLKEQEEERQRRLLLEKKRQQLLLSSAKKYGQLYEYEVLSFGDDGAIDVNKIQNTLNDYAALGWRVKTSYTNELGHNSSSGGYGGMSTGYNSTVCQHIVILERKLLT